MEKDDKSRLTYGLIARIGFPDLCAVEVLPATTQPPEALAQGRKASKGLMTEARYPKNCAKKF